MNHSGTIHIEQPLEDAPVLIRKAVRWRHDLKTGRVQVRSDLGWVTAGRTIHASQEPEPIASEFAASHNLEITHSMGAAVGRDACDWAWDEYHRALSTPPPW